MCNEIPSGGEVILGLQMIRVQCLSNETDSANQVLFHTHILHHTNITVKHKGWTHRTLLPQWQDMRSAHLHLHAETQVNVNNCQQLHNLWTKWTMQVNWQADSKLNKVKKDFYKLKQKFCLNLYSQLEKWSIPPTTQQKICFWEQFFMCKVLIQTWLSMFPFHKFMFTLASSIHSAWSLALRLSIHWWWNNSETRTAVIRKKPFHKSKPVQSKSAYKRCTHTSPACYDDYFQNEMIWNQPSNNNENISQTLGSTSAWQSGYSKRT